MAALIPIAAVGALAVAGLALIVVGRGQSKTPEERAEEDREQIKFLQEWSSRKRK